MRIIITILVIAIITSCASVNKHIWGYEKAILVKDVEPVSLYYSIAGVEDKVWWEMPTVRERSVCLARELNYLAYADKTGAYILIGKGSWVMSDGDTILGYSEDWNVAPIACSGDGKWLYILEKDGSR